MNWYKPASLTDVILGPLKNWSFSGLKTYENCAFRRFLEKVGGHKQPSGPAATRGSDYHDKIEKFIRRESPELPKMKDHIEIYIRRKRDKFDDGFVTVEENWCIDRNWKTVKFENRWGIFIIDCFERESKTSAIITDWKTGKSRGNEMKHAEQLVFYAAACFARYTELEYIHVAAGYIDENFIGLERGYSREQIDPMREQISKRATIMTTATDFPPCPTRGNCKWCEFKTMLDNDGNVLCPWGII